MAVIAMETLAVGMGYGIDRVVGSLLGLLFGYWIYRHPYAGVKFILVWIPAGTILLSWAFALGVPGGVVRSGALIKDVVGLAILVAGFNVWRARGRPATLLDRFGIAYLAALVLWTVLTPLVASPPLSLNARLIGIRTLGLFVALFLGLRWLEPTADDKASIRRWGLGVALVLGAAGVYQWLEPDAFRRLIEQRMGLGDYYSKVAGLSGPALTDGLRWFRGSPLRVSSFVLAPFAFADVMLAGACLGIADTARRLSALSIITVVVCGAGIVLSGTRINMVALAFVVVWAILGVRGYSEAARVRFVVLALVALLFFAPSVLSSRLTGDTATSNAGHITELTTSWEAVLTNPLGSGVGSAGGITRRTSSYRTLVPGSTFSGLGMQAGWGVLVLFVGFVGAAVARAWHNNRLAPEDPYGGAAMLILIGGLVAGLTHNAWTSLTSGGYVWVLVALGCGIPRTGSGQEIDASTSNLLVLPYGAAGGRSTTRVESASGGA